MEQTCSLKDTEEMGDRRGEVDCGDEAYIRKCLKNQAMPRKIDHQEGDVLKKSLYISCSSQLYLSLMLTLPLLFLWRVRTKEKKQIDFYKFL